MNSKFTQDFIKELLDRIDILEATITTLTEENTRLKEQLNKNSKNSSNPPSSDVFYKPTPKKELRKVMQYVVLIRFQKKYQVKEVDKVK